MKMIQQAVAAQKKYARYTLFLRMNCNYEFDLHETINFVQMLECPCDVFELAQGLLDFDLEQYSI